MDITNNTLQFIESYNCLIKYQIKCFPDKGKAELSHDIVFPNIEFFKAGVLSILETETYPDNFIDLISRIYLLSEANSDLLTDFPRIRKSLSIEALKFDKFFLDIFQFLREHIFHAENEYGNHVSYKGFEEDELSRYPEYLFKENRYLLFPTYRLLLSVTNAYFKQISSDFENRLSFKEKQNIHDYRQEQKEKLAEDIISLSTDFCDREFPFSFVSSHSFYQQSYLFGFLLSDVLEKESIENYEKYIRFDYSLYPDNFRWEFHRYSISEYTGLSELNGFERLVKILASTLLLKELDNSFDTDKNPIEKGPDNEIRNPNREKSIKGTNSEYILPIPVLNAVFEEFNDEIWEEISLVDFLNMFTTTINKQAEFKLKSKQTTRFYYLMKKLWINSDQSLFESEKKWIIPFLANYNLSYSAYTNQSVKNEEGMKHQKFIRRVDKLLPKEDTF